MRTISFILFCSMTASSLLAQETDTTFSARTKNVLNEAYPQWQLQKNYGNNYVQGDFDGDGYTDHALQISYRDSTTDKGGTQALVVILERPGKAEVRFLEHADELTSLHTVEKGETACVVHTNDCFELVADAIGVGYEEKASWLYIWDGEKFVQILTGD